MNDNREHTVEISFTKTKMYIIVARALKHMRIDFPHMQGKKMVELAGGYD